MSFVQYSYAQSVGVGYENGEAQVDVPLYTFKKGDIVLPISIQHKSSGLKIKDVEGSVGMNWNLIAGGAITRELRDLPDDLPIGQKGWLFNTNGLKINAFNIQNDNNTTTCNDETADKNYLNTNFSDLSDTEPDIFHINLPGISCKLIFDADRKPRTIPYHDIKVTYVTNANSGITSFKIIDDKGLTYDFELVENATKTAYADNASGIVFYKNLYEKYKTQITYALKWHLTKITDKNRRQVKLSYSTIGELTKYSRKPYDFYLGNTSTKTTQFQVVETLRNYMISSIDYSVDGVFPYTNEVKFSFGENWRTGMPILYYFNAGGKSWNFRYDAGGAIDNNYFRNFLSEIVNGADWSTVFCRFTYRGLTKMANKDEYTIKLPDSSSKAVDRWGYYDGSQSTTLLPSVYVSPPNPVTPGLDRFRNTYKSSLASLYPYSLSGRSRDADTASIKIGALIKVDIVDGKQTEIEYESNSYYDPQASETVLGGGLRVKRLTSYYKSAPNSKEVVNYSYINPATGISSGKAVSLPVFSFLRAYTGTGTTEQKWQQSIVRSEQNLSPEDDGILYSHVKESVAGKGSTLFEFLVPATHFDTSAGADWTPVFTNVAACTGAGYLFNDKKTYPFVPPLNVDIERSIPKLVQVYNEIGQKVAETSYIYSRVGVPFYISGLRFELNNGTMTYVKYRTITGIRNMSTEEKKITYDLVNNVQQQNLTNYFYESNNHLYATKADKLNSDGSITRAITKYSKDYPSTVAVDGQSLAIKKLNDNNVNIEVERYTQIVRAGVGKTISGELTKFSVPPGLDVVRPVQKLSFYNAGGASDFNLSAINAGQFTHDSRYFPTLNYKSFSQTGLPATTDDNKGNTSSVFYDLYTESPVSVFKNAADSEVIYSDFENRGYFGFDLENNSFSPVMNEGRTGNNGYTLAPVQTLYKDLKKKAGTGWYVFSIWLNSNSAGNLQLTLLSSSNVSSNHSLSFTGSNGSWKYYVVRVPVSSMTENFKLKFKSTVEVKIDDVLFYPAEATVNTFNYHPTTFEKMSETDNNGITRFYDYDKLGRVRHVYDEQKNMLLRNTYVKAEDFDTFKPSIGSEDKIIYNTSAEFSSRYSELNNEGMSHTWDFGDGSPLVYSNLPSGAVNHTYTVLGTYTVKLTKFSPLYGTETVTKVITVINPPGVGITSSGGDVAVGFSQGPGTTIYFSPEDIANGYASVPAGVYEVRISSMDPYGSTNPYGYKFIGYTATNPGGALSGADCQVSQPRVNSYVFTIDLRGKTAINLYTSTTSCELLEM